MNTPSDNPDPMDELRSDHVRARQKLDQNTNVCFLATLDDTEGPQVRTLVLRDIGERSIGLFMNRSSPKWQQLLAHPRAQILIWYPSIERQYRLSGLAEPMDPALVADSWQLRPDPSKYLDYFYENVSHQSMPLKSRQALLDGLDRQRETLLPPEQLAAPPQAAGIYLTVDRIDRLDLSDPGRVHDRRLFLYQDDNWQEQVLVP